MDELTQTLLTIAANSLITYFLLKRQENRYAKEMEKFRASLQLSNFAEQTKFAYIHAKRVETLETLYRKFAIFGETMARLISKMERSVQKYPEKSPVNLKEIENELRPKYEDFGEYFISIRLFLPEDFVTAVHNVMRKSELIHKTLWSMIDTIGDETPVPNELIDEINRWMNKEYGDLDIGDREKILHKMHFELLDQYEVMRNLYTSIADTKA